jgi:hypothetical protein
MKDWKSRLYPYLFFALLSLGVMGPLLAPGYIFALDMTFGPTMASSHELYGLQGGLLNAQPLIFTVHLLNRLIPAWVTQKIIVFLILFLSGVGAYHLCPASKAGKYFAGLLYMINPFIYARFLAGQRGLLLAYAITPFAVRAFIELMEERSLKKAIEVALLTTLVAIFLVQVLALVLLAYLIIAIAVIVRKNQIRSRTYNALQVGKYLLLSAAMFGVLNIYWLLPAFSTATPILEQITEVDFAAFAPLPTTRIAFDLASMYGFWRGGYIYTRDVLPTWWLILLFILFLVVYGYLVSRRDKRTGWIAHSFASTGIISLVFATGYSVEATQPVYQWLLLNIPFFAAFRDSQKFVALLCLTYSYLGGLGISVLMAGVTAERVRKMWQNAAIKKMAAVGTIAFLIFALVSPVVYCFTMFGFHNQLQPTDYPADWYEIKEYLGEDEEDFNILFLPWHLYMDYSWIPQPVQRAGNVPPAFFGQSVISGDNIEMGTIYTESANPVSAYISFLLRNSAGINNFGELVSPLNVKYVVLVNEADYQDYDFLHRQDDLSVTMAKDGITLFRNEHFTSRVYGVDSIVYIEDWSQYLALSRTQDVMEHVYSLDKGIDESGLPGTEAITLKKKGEVSYQVSGTSQKYTVFTLPRCVSADGWEFAGKPALKNLGLMPAFSSEDDGGTITFAKFYREYLPVGIISLISLAALGTIRIWKHHHS